MKFLYYLACIGKPDLNIKITILKKKINYIYKNINNPFDIIINLYELDNDIIKLITDTLSDFTFIKKKYIYSKKGVLTELFLTNIYNNKIDDYDYILFILDGT